MMTVTRVDSIEPISRSEAHTLAATENERVSSLLRSLSDTEWARPTDCALWDVRALAGHMVGEAETFTGYRSLMHTMRTAQKEAGDGLVVDAMTALQVRELAPASTYELIARMQRAAPRQANWRATRRMMRLGAMKQRMPDGTVEKWKFGFLLDTILTRDPWMHRVDLSLATGRDMVLTADHDGRIVADVVAEWARRHGKPFTLTLTGPAGGTYASGTDGESIELDAVEFCRILSGRAKGDGLLTQEVPF